MKVELFNPDHQPGIWWHLPGPSSLAFFQGVPVSTCLKFLALVLTSLPSQALTPPSLLPASLQPPGPAISPPLQPNFTLLVTRVSPQILCDFINVINSLQR